jgi:hypothetical protein
MYWRWNTMLAFDTEAESLSRIDKGRGYKRTTSRNVDPHAPPKPVAGGAFCAIAHAEGVASLLSGGSPMIQRLTPHAALDAQLAFADLSAKTVLRAMCKP